ncbi:PMD domain-containing protein [Cephalotus follicularis]|uniref:PMD domain-containing protein n=1 Tax=Cephalotus follicularis TaxID=3775 RepID=A0A1Q3BRP6_CEPFO|nr:PMD domain-containing protein [Cephalotus follicularis]
MGLQNFLARWSTQTHTFIISFREISYSLEDVATQFHLPLFGDENVQSLTASPEEKLMNTALIKSLKASNVGSARATFSSWIKYHFGSAVDEKKCLLDFEKGKGFKPKLNLAAFIAFWLSRYVFPCLLVDGVNRSLFMLAIKISKGDRFYLAPLFVGSLYKRLDLYKRSMEAFLGHNYVLCFVDTAAL